MIWHKNKLNTGDIKWRHIFFLTFYSDLKAAKLRKKKQKNSQPKELFPSKSNNSGLKDVTRSPLSARTTDMNSPANIVQRKQIKDVDKKMTCAQENASSRFIVREKENM